MVENVHPLAEVRRELAEIVARKDAEALAELLRGERLPSLGGHAEPAELIHGALVLAPAEPRLTRGVGSLVGALLEQRAALLQEQLAAGRLVMSGGGGAAVAVGGGVAASYLDDAGYVANCLRISELLPRQEELFAGVSTFFEVGFSLAALTDDAGGLGRRLREALRWQQLTPQYEGYWQGLIERGGTSRSDLLDGWSGILWLKPHEDKSEQFRRLDRALRAFAKSSLEHTQHMALLGWAVRTLADAYPRSTEYWQEGLAEQAADWPEDLLLVFQERWPGFAPALPAAEVEIPASLEPFWQSLDSAEREKILAIAALNQPEAWKALWQRELVTLLMKPRGGVQVAVWSRQFKDLRRHFESIRPELIAGKPLGLEAEDSDSESMVEDPVLQARVNSLEALQRVDKVLGDFEAQLRKGQVSRAAQYLGDLIAWQRGTTEPQHIAKTLARAATIYARYNQLEAAQERLEEAIELMPDDPVPRTGLAEVLKSRGELAEAERWYRETVTRFPENVVARAGLAEVLKSRRQLAEAERWYRETVTRFPSDVVARTGLAEVLKSRGELAEAERWYRETVTRFPSDVVARSGLAELLKSRGELAEAERWYRETVTRFPESVVARSGLAEVLKSRGELAEAERWYRETVTRFPSDVVARNGLAEVLKSRGELAEAERWYRETVMRFPENVVARNGLAEVLKGRGELVEAERWYRETVTRFPSDVVARNGLANLLRSLRRFEEALTLCQAPERLGTPQSYIDNHLRAMIFFGKGDHAEAERLLRQGLEGCPTGSRGYYQGALALVALWKGDWNTALAETSDDKTPVAKVLQFHAYAGRGETSSAKSIRAELEGRVLLFPVRRSFEALKEGFGMDSASGLRQPSAEQNELIFESEIEMLSLAA